MSEHVQDLAERFLEVHNAVVAAAAACPNARWHLIPPGEERPVGVLFHHIIAGYIEEIELIKAILKEQPIPWLYESDAALDRYNAEYAEEHKDCTKADTLVALEQHGRSTAEFIQELSDEDLRKTTDHPQFFRWENAPVPVEVFIEIVIDHPQHHLREIQEAVGLT